MNKPTQKNLRDIISSHELWLKSGGTAGARADFGRRKGWEFWTDDNRLVIMDEQPAIRLATLLDPQDQSVLRGVDLRNARFDSADLSGIQFIDCSLDGASFVGANVTNACFDNSSLARCDLTKISGQMASFKEVDLSYANLAFAGLVRANFQDAILTNSSLIHADLTESNLHNVSATNATFERSNLARTNLSRGDFAHAGMTYATLREAEVTDARFDDSDLLRADLSSIHGARLSMQRSRLIRAQFSGSQLVDANFSECVLRGAIFDGANVYKCVFDRADLRQDIWEESISDGGNLRHVVRQGRPSAINAVFRDCRLYGAWINSDLLPWLSMSIVCSAIHVEGGAMSNTGRIFIAHANEDLDMALQLYAQLASQGFMPWIDKRDLKAGEEWQRVIPLTIQGSRAVVICLSQNAIKKRGYIQNEFRTALETLRNLPLGQVFILPIRFDECDVPEEFQKFHWIDYWEPDFLSRITYTLQALSRDA